MKTENDDKTVLKKINLSEKLSLFKDHWNPKIVGELNNQHIKLAKIKGEFIWHKHDDEDEMFLVLKGTLKIAFRDRTETIQENEIIIVPKGVDHKPIAEDEVSIMLFEPATTINTGTIENKYTRKKLDSLYNEAANFSDRCFYRKSFYWKSSLCGSTRKLARR
jgi:mannose-6-phosphate isomerase-like protein (cupin superfamily)